MSVDEIWADQSRPTEAKAAAAEAAAAAVAEEEITFEDNPGEEVSPPAPSPAPESAASKPSELFTKMNPPPEPDEADEVVATSSPPNDYEMVGDAREQDEMDELEAEIARELNN